MSAPFNDIGINPPVSDRRRTEGCVATVATITYGMVVIGDTGTTNFRDVKLPAGAGGTGVRGIVADQGDPNNLGKFATGDEFGVCIDGSAEVLLDAGQIATKDAPAITGATPGTVKPVAAESAPYDVVGYFDQTYDNSAGSAPVLVSLRVSPQRRFA
jgi:hypothetical protein